MIPVHAAHFDESAIARSGMGAGIVPFSRAPDGELRILLGRERFLPQWKGSCRWSGFEGSRKDGETLHETARREYVEETLGVTGDAAPRAVETGEDWIRIVLCVAHDRRTNERFHAMHLVPIPWDETFPDAFQRRRLEIEQIDRTLQEWRHWRPLHLLGAEDDVGKVRRDEGGTLRIHKRASSTDILRAPWTVDPDDPTLVCADVPSDDPSHAPLARWVALRERLERTLISHPSVRVRRDAHSGHLQDVHVSKDHLEKDQIRWWTPSELRAVLEGHGQLGTDRFRPYFLPVLQTLLQELSAASPTLLPHGSPSPCP